MKINEKISKFFNERGISQKEIADSYGGTSQNVWNILNKQSGNVPIGFLVWIAENYPELDINVLLLSDSTYFQMIESNEVYEKKPATKQEILAEMSKVLDKYL